MQSDLDLPFLAVSTLLAIPSESFGCTSEIQNQTPPFLRQLQYPKVLKY